MVNDKLINLISELFIYTYQESICIERNIIKILDKENIDIIAEGTNIDNLKRLRDFSKETKNKIKQIKILISEDNKDEARSLLEKTIKDTEDMKKYIINNPGDNSSRLYSAILFSIKESLPAIVSLVLFATWSNRIGKETFPKFSKLGYISNHKVITIDVKKYKELISEIKKFNMLQLATLSIPSLLTFISICKISTKCKDYERKTGTKYKNYLNVYLVEYLDKMLKVLNDLKLEL